MPLRRALVLAVSLLASTGLDAAAQPLLYGPVPIQGWGQGVALGRMEIELSFRTLLFVAEGVRPSSGSLLIYDVTDPGEPSLLGSLVPDAASCPTGSYATSVSLLGTRAYLAAGTCGVLVVEVGDPSAPRILLRVSSLDFTQDVLPRSTTGGVELLIADGTAGLRVIQLADINGTPSVQQQVQIGSAQGILGAALAVDADPASGIAVVATTSGVFEVKVGPGAPLVGTLLVTNPSNLPLGQLDAVPSGVAVRDDYAYVPLWKGGLVVFDLLSPSNPMRFGNPTVETPHAFFNALVLPSGATLLASEGQCGLAVFDVTSEGLSERPGSPLPVAGTDPKACGPQVTDASIPFAWSLAEQGGLAAVGFGVTATGGGGFELLEQLETLPVRAPAAVPAPEPEADPDVDADGRVGAPDLLRLARAFGARAGEARYDARADLDADGVIGAGDLLRLSAAFGS